jgi:surface protein
MRKPLIRATTTLVVLLLYELLFGVLCFSEVVEAAPQGLRGGEYDDNQSSNGAYNRSIEGQTVNGLRSSSSVTDPDEHSNSNSKKKEKKYRLSGQQTRREAKCNSDEKEVCGHGLGYLLCEYDDERDIYATRCVRQNKVSLHLQLHRKNYCGTCRRCFENTDELRQAVTLYLRNSTRHTEVANSYGWPMNKWCVSKISDFSSLFANQRKFNEDIGSWDMSSARNLSGLFQAAFKFDQDLSGWDLSRVEDMSKVFDCAYAFNHPLSDWDTANVKSMARAFRVAKAFNQDLSGWNTARVTDMSYMFYRAHSFDTSVDFDVSNVRDMSYMFSFTRKFNHSSIKNWKTTNVKTMRGMFQNTQAFAQDLSHWDVAHVNDMAFLFHQASEFQQHQEKQREIVKHWDLSHVQDKQAMLEIAHAAMNMTNLGLGEGIAHPSYYDKNQAAGALVVEAAEGEGGRTSTTRAASEQGQHMETSTTRTTR